MTLTDQLAERLMSALPVSHLGTVVFTGIMGALLLAASIHCLGWWATAGILVAAAHVAALSIRRELGLHS